MEGKAEEGLRVSKARLMVSLHPACANHVQQALRHILNSLLLRYNDELEGVVLAYLNIDIPCHSAKILPGLSPYFKANLTATFLLFSPKPGMTLEGKVIKIEKDYIGVLLLGLFNAAIGFNDIREEFHYVEQQSDLQSWVSKLFVGHIIKPGTVIRFSVKSVQEKGEILDIAGSLQPTSTGSVDWFHSSEYGKHGSFGLGKDQKKHAERKQKRKHGKDQEDGSHDKFPSDNGKEQRSLKKVKKLETNFN